MLEGSRPLQQALQASTANRETWQQPGCPVGFTVPLSGGGKYSPYQKELEEQLHMITVQSTKPEAENQMAEVSAPLDHVVGVLENVGCAGWDFSPPACLQECSQQAVPNRGHAALAVGS